MIYDDVLDDDELKSYTQSLNSRAKALGSKGRILIANLRDRIYASGGKCEWCTASILRQAFEVDHIISLSNGGGNTADNLAVACPDCNRRKASKHPARFAQETVSRTGIITPLIQRVLDHFGLQATVQRPLFADPEQSPPTIILDDDLPDDPPPYRWGN